MSSLARTSRLYAFGPFRFDAAGRILIRDRERVPLTPKAADLLLVLIEGGGRVLNKDVLLDEVWGDEANVGETTLTHHISKLRKALGNGERDATYIETIPKRGYRFVAAVSEGGELPT